MRARLVKGMIASALLVAGAGMIFHGCGGGGSGSRDATATFEDRSSIFQDGDVNQGLCGDAATCTTALLSGCFGLDSSELPEMIQFVAASVNLDAARVICRAVQAAGFRSGVSTTAEPLSI